jgi:hypothetical protein
MEHESRFSGLNFFGKIVIGSGKTSTKYINSYIALPFLRHRTL